MENDGDVPCEEQSFRPPHLIYLILAQLIFSHFAYGSSLWLNSKTLVGPVRALRKQGVAVSHLLTLHIIFWFPIALVTLFHNSYLIMLWRPRENLLDPVFFYYSGILYIGLQNAPPVILFFLTVDRSLALTLTVPGKLRKVQGLLAALCVLVCAGVVGGIFVMFLTTAPHPFPQSTCCLTPGCLSTSRLVTDRINLIRMFVSGLNIFAAVILICQIYRLRFFNAYGTRRQMAVFVVKVLFVQCGLDLGVHLVGYVTKLLWGLESNLYFGPYAKCFAALDGFICALMYSRTFYRMRNRSWTLSVS